MIETFLNRGYHDIYINVNLATVLNLCNYDGRKDIKRYLDYHIMYCKFSFYYSSVATFLLTRLSWISRFFQLYVYKARYASVRYAKVRMSQMFGINY